MGWLAENPPSVGELFFGGGSGSTGTPPTITLNPASRSVDEYANVTFTGAASGDEPITYQWYKNGSPVGTNSDSYTMTAAAADNDATVYFTATNASGSETSSAATLTVVSYAFALNGTNQSIQLSGDVTLNGDFDVSFRYKGTGGNYYPLLVKSDGTVVARIDAGGTMRAYIGSGVLTTSSVINDNVDRLISIVRVGQVLSIKIGGVTNVSSNSANNLGTVIFSKIAERLGSYTPGIFRNFIVSSGGAPYADISLRNKALGANQPATVGSINATITNYNAANWVVI